MHFHSDDSGNYPGFQITYSSVEGLPGCGGTFTAERGEIHSPGFDGEYPPDIACEYKIKVSQNSRIKITFLSFRLEASSDCSADHLTVSLKTETTKLFFLIEIVQIYSGHSTDSPLIGRYCGYNIPAPFISDSNELLIVFQTDWAIGYAGFHLRYETSKMAKLK